jgi:hypothetical protein
MKGVARTCKSVWGKESGRLRPEAGCLPVEDRNLFDDDAAGALARSQQVARE